MQPSQIGHLLNVNAQTLRRWAKDYAPFLSPGANPPKGQTRVFDTHDQRVFLFISELRAVGQTNHEIQAALERERDREYEGLPLLPPDWGNTDTVELGIAQARASEIARMASMQIQLQHITERLQEAQERVKVLEGELTTSRGTADATEHARVQLELDLARAHGDVETLKARLASYTLGGDKPISVALIIAVTAVVAVALVLLVFIVARLVM